MASISAPDDRPRGSRSVAIVTASTLRGRSRRNDDQPDFIERAPAPNQPPSGFILILGSEAWSMADHALARVGMKPCPCCGGRELPRMAYCLGCDRTGLDERVTFPGLPVGQYLDPDYDVAEDRKIRFKARRRPLREGRQRRTG